MRLLRGTLFLVLILTMISACGGLRYSQVAPDIGDFHPQKICVFPVNAGAYTETVNIANNLITNAVLEQEYFAAVISPEQIAKLEKKNNDLKHAMVEYLAKLKKVNFSDPDISGYIGKKCGADALLVVDVDFWNYTTQENGKLAKVGFTMDLIEARTGKIMWKAKHYDTKKYKWLKPDLTDFAEDVAETMISRMPH